MDANTTTTGDLSTLTKALFEAVDGALAPLAPTFEAIDACPDTERSACSCPDPDCITGDLCGGTGRR